MGCGVISTLNGGNTPLIDFDTHEVSNVNGNLVYASRRPASCSLSNNNRNSIRNASSNRNVIPLPDNRLSQHAYRVSKRLSLSEAPPVYLGEIVYKELEFGDSLGIGSFGEVFSGKIRGQKCAIKRIFMGRNIAERTEILFDFEKEVAILSRLRHERIVTFLGIASRKAFKPAFSKEALEKAMPNSNDSTPDGSNSHGIGEVQQRPDWKTPFSQDDGERRCLIFELCEGSVASLLKLVRKKKCAVTWRICLTIAHDAAEAVNYLHNLSPPVLHRDLKAENFLLTSNFRCKLTDFGLSRPFPTSVVGDMSSSTHGSANSVTAAMYESDNTNHGNMKHIRIDREQERRSTMTVCGTPCWVAPEIFRNEPYNEKVDVYSFGIVLWELFTGKKPHADKKCADLPYLVGKKGLRPALLPHCPPSLNDLMKDCWNEAQEFRPTFEEILIRLNRIEEEVNALNRMQCSAHVLNSSWEKIAKNRANNNNNVTSREVNPVQLNNNNNNNKLDYPLKPLQYRQPDSAMFDSNNNNNKYSYEKSTQKEEKDDDADFQNENDSLNKTLPSKPSTAIEIDNPEDLDVV